MKIQPGIRLIVAAAVCCAIVGCHRLGDNKVLKYLGDANLSYYRDRATQIEYPHLEGDDPNPSIVTQPPRRIRHPRKDDLQNLPLAKAIQMAMVNNKIIRDRNQFMSPQNSLLVGPNLSNNSIYDPSLQETGVSIGNRGLNSALADFDTSVTTSLLWGRNETVQNNAFLSGGLRPGDTLKEETAVFRSGIEKPMGDGGLFSVTHNWNYSLSNVPSRLFGSSYTGSLQFDYRRPLWAASGTEFTRIVGPVGRNMQNIPVIFQGVVVARINNDISVTSFEMNVRNMLKDVEDLYWDLALTYHTYHSEIVARDSALGTWRNVKANVGRPGIGTAEEALARDNYFEARARAENALADLYSSETQLRRILGLPVNDGKILRPSDEPVKSELVPNWQLALTEALTRRVELRRQKWQIKSLELQKKAAESLTKPRFDFVSSGRVNGFGDRLLGRNDNDGITRHGLRTGYGTLTQGDQTGWTLGFEAWIPLGFRQAHTQVRNFEIRILKARAALAAQENEISHELSIAFQNLDRWYQTAKTNFNRRRAADTRVRTYATLIRRDPQKLDLLLRAQISLAQADISYHRSLIEYNKAIVDLHFRKGTSLELNHVILAESLWSPEAYNQALRRAWSRSHAFDNQYLKTEPQEFVTASAGYRSATEERQHLLLTPEPDGNVPPSPTENEQTSPQETAPLKPAPGLPETGSSVTKANEAIPFENKPIDLITHASAIKVSVKPEPLNFQQPSNKKLIPIPLKPSESLPRTLPSVTNKTVTVSQNSVEVSKQLATPVKNTSPVKNEVSSKPVSQKRFPSPRKATNPAEQTLFPEPGGFRAIKPSSKGTMKRLPLKD